jgi:hypothetical protein
MDEIIACNFPQLVCVCVCECACEPRCGGSWTRKQVAMLFGQVQRLHLFTVNSFVCSEQTDKEASFPKPTDSLLHTDKVINVDFRKITTPCKVIALVYVYCEHGL